MLAVLDVLLESACCAQAGLEILGVLIDIVFWKKGRPNRESRRNARAAGEPVPRMNRWAWLFIIVLAIVVLSLLARVAAIALRG